MVYKVNTYLIVHVLSFLVDCHHLLFMTTTTVNPFKLVLCGMVRTVQVEIIAVLIPTCHGSIIRYRWLLAKTLRQEYAVMKNLIMKMFWLDNSNCLYSSESMHVPTAAFFATITLAIVI